MSEPDDRAGPAAGRPAVHAPAGWDCHVHVFDAARAAAPGHYRPADHPLPAIEALAAAHGIGHLVLVQPSVYGHDHGLLAEALSATPGRHRGVAVLSPALAGAALDRELDRLQALGVRGHRFNLVSPAGHAGFPDEALARLSPRLRERGWHLQWYLRVEQLPQLRAALQALPAAQRPLCVLDHLAGLQAGLPLDGAAWQAARALAADGAWIKLSGWYRLHGGEPPYPAVDAAIAAAVAAFGPRCVWGSDWPHTAFAPDALPRYADQLAPLQRRLPPATLQAVLQPQAAQLYASA